MRHEDIQEVWSMLDRPHLCELSQRGPEVSFATISGAHLYGFASPDSDVDVRGAVLFPLERMLGLEPPDETISIAEKQPVDVDFVAARHTRRVDCQSSPPRVTPWKRWWFAHG